MQLPSIRFHVHCTVNARLYTRKPCHEIQKVLFLSGALGILREKRCPPSFDQRLPSVYFFKEVPHIRRIEPQFTVLVVHFGPRFNSREKGQPVGLPSSPFEPTFQE
jgi:hypothetical protein